MYHGDTARHENALPVRYKLCREIFLALRVRPSVHLSVCHQYYNADGNYHAKQSQVVGCVVRLLYAEHSH